MTRCRISWYIIVVGILKKKSFSDKPVETARGKIIFESEKVIIPHQIHYDTNYQPEFWMPILCIDHFGMVLCAIALALFQCCSLKCKKANCYYNYFYFKMKHLSIYFFSDE